MRIQHREPQMILTKCIGPTPCVFSVKYILENTINQIKARLHLHRGKNALKTLKDQFSAKKCVRQAD